jgi:hypothetical protein
MVKGLLQEVARIVRPGLGLKMATLVQSWKDVQTGSSIPENIPRHNRQNRVCASRSCPLEGKYDAHMAQFVTVQFFNNFFAFCWA